MKKLLSLTLGLTILCGCAGYGTVTKNLADDGAILRIHNPVYGSIVRIGGTTNSVEVTPDGSIIINGRNRR